MGRTAISLIFVPSGVSESIKHFAPREVKISLAHTEALPFAQSSAIESPSKRTLAVETT